MNKLKKNLQQFREWVRNLRRNRKKPQTSQPVNERRQPAAQTAPADQKMTVQAKAAAVQAGKELHQQGVGQAQAVNQNDPPTATPGMHQAGQDNGGSSWKREDSMRRQPRRKQKKGKRL